MARCCQRSVDSAGSGAAQLATTVTIVAACMPPSTALFVVSITTTYGLAT
eukprot:COSAG02_NODE_60320_length_271_cov_1.209302_1_plen_49_part_10